MGYSWVVSGSVRRDGNGTGIEMVRWIEDPRFEEEAAVQPLRAQLATRTQALFHVRDSRRRRRDARVWPFSHRCARVTEVKQRPHELNGSDALI